MSIDVNLLGTGSPIPDPERAGSAILVQAAGRTLLFDSGRGVVMRLAAAGTGPGVLDRLLFTHLHSDHVTDFNDLITTRWVTAPTSSPLGVTGPPGTARFTDATLAMLADDIGWRIAHHADLNEPPRCDVLEVTEGTAFESGELRVVAAPTDHRPVHPTVGYRIEHHGRSVVVAGDTVPCEGLDRLCAGADIYLQTVVRPDLVRKVPFPRFQDILDYHSSCEDAGRTAARGGVRTLVLTHPVPAPATGTESEWIAQAATEFEGEIVLAHDLLTLSA